MKIRNHSRIVAFALALVMILPLISIPTFAEETVATPAYRENFDGQTLSAVAGKPASAKITSAAADVATHGDVIQVDVKGMNTAAYYLWMGSNNKWPITGEVVDGQISGTANGLTVPATDVPENDDDATKKVTIGETTYTIVTGTYADSMGGFNNIAAPITFKNPAIASADAAFAAIEFDLYLSESFKNTSGVSGRVAVTSKNVELFEITAVNGTNPKLSSHENGKIVSGAAAALTLGTWNTLLFIVDMSTAEVGVYLNGEFAFKETNSTAISAAIDIKESTLQVQIDRNCAPATNGGFIQVDNVLVTTDLSEVGIGGTVYSEDFNSATDKSEVITSSSAAGLASIQAAALDAGKYGNVFHAPAQSGGEGYYIMSDQNHSSQLTSYTIDEETGLISGTTADGKVVVNSVINETKNADVTKTGTQAVLQDGTTGWYVVEAIYRNAWQGGFNIAGNGGQLKNPALTPFLGVDTFTFSASYYFSEDASFTNQGRLYAYRGSGNANKAYDLFQMTAANGNVTITHHGDALVDRTSSSGLKSANKEGTSVTVPAGQWFTVDMVINFTTAKMDLYVDGYWVFSLTDTDFAGGINSLLANNWSVTMFSRGTGALNNTGYCDVDNVSITYGSAMPEVDATTYIYRNDFNYQKVGAAPSTALQTIPAKDTTISDEYGSKAWKVVNNAGNNYNMDTNNKILTPALSYENYNSIVLEADYFIDSQSIGSMECQLQGATFNGEKINNGWNNLYMILFDSHTAKASLQVLSKTIATMTVGEWHTVSTVIDLDSGLYEVYLDGVLKTAEGTSITGKGNVSIPAGINLGKVNKFKSDSTFLVDNIKVFEGTEIFAKPAVDTEKELVDFEEFKYASDNLEAKRTNILAVPSLAKFVKENGNTVLRIDMGPASSADTYVLYTTENSGKIFTLDKAYTPGDEKVTYNKEELNVLTDEEINLPYVNLAYDHDNKAETDNVEAKFYIIPHAVAEQANGATNVAAATQVLARTLSYKNGKTAILEEDVFIEEGSTGIIESQFNAYKYYTTDAETGDLVENKGEWLQLFHIHMDTGLLAGQGNTNYGVYLNKGEWNNIKVVVDLETGEFSIYANGVLARTYDCGKDNLVIENAWIIAKVQRHNNPNGEVWQGALRIDNVRVSTAGVPTSNSQYGANFLTDADFEAFVADILTSVPGASIRLSNPSGLRFGSKVDTAKLTYLTEFAGAKVEDQGTIIAPASYMNAAGAFTKEALDQLKTAGKVSTAYLDVKFDGVYFSGDKGFDASNGSYMVGSIVKILKDNINREFAGAAYIELAIGGNTYSIYADAQVRSVMNVAASALEDDKAEWTDAQIAILEAYAAGNQPS